MKNPIYEGEKLIAKLTFYNVSKMTMREKRKLEKWVKSNASEIIEMGGCYADRYTARYLGGRP